MMFYTLRNKRMLDDELTVETFKELPTFYSLPVLVLGLLISILPARRGWF